MGRSSRLAAPRYLQSVEALGRHRLFFALSGLWLALLVPSIPLSDHTCHGFVGLLAHSPLYAFQGLTVVLVVHTVVSSGRARHRPR